MAYHKLALIYILAASWSTSIEAFAPVSTLSRANAGPINMVATTPAALGMDVEETTTEDKMGSMIDLNGIVFSGLKGKALSLKAEDFPKSGEVRSVIPEDCFVPETAKSLGYLGVSLAGTALCTAVGISMNDVIGHGIWTFPIWTAYAAVTGTVGMGLWVLAHECGHGAFSPNKKLQDAIGFILHSILLVPYFSWQRSHAVHHQYTNHMELGETHVPEELSENGSYQTRQKLLETFGDETGIKVWGALQGFLHLGVGWPGYLLLGATGGPDRGMTNHFYPNPLTTPPNPKKELFPGNWKEKVYQSDIGIAAVVGALVAWTATRGFGEVMALYGGPLLVINAWLVLYTWLQHTDTDVPHFTDEDHNFVRGALHTIDRPYDKMDPWGLIDFLHHKIGSTHVAHHFDSSIPHYKAQAATEAIAKNFPELYLYEPTPIFEALWRVCKGCAAVEKRGDKYVWKNNGVEELVA
jgi:omega-6 fatty acid desaturase (delta-12 desaturase)